MSSMTRRVIKSPFDFVNGSVEIAHFLSVKGSIAGSLFFQDYILMNALCKGIKLFVCFIEKIPERLYILKN